MGTIQTAWGLQAYPIRVEVSTTSDWTLVNITGLNDVRLFEANQGENVICTNKGEHITIWVGKTQYDETRTGAVIELVAVTPSSEIGIQIQKGYVGTTEVNIKAWDVTHYARILKVVHGQTLGDPAENRRIETVGLPALVQYSVELIETPDEPPEVVAAYYPWYSGGGRHWGETEGDGASESTHFPLLGMYDSSDQIVLERHVEEASNAGITAFASSWWGIDGYEDYVLGKLASISVENGFKFTVLYESIRDEPLDTPEKVSAELNYIIEQYGSSPSFLTWKGMPVIYIFSPGSQSRDEGFWLEVQDQLLMDAVLAFVPEEERVQYSAMTGQSLFYMGETDLKHKVLAIAEEEGAERASYALKLLQSEGKLSIASTGNSPSSTPMPPKEYTRTTPNA